jgi:hypothetical protein
LLFAFSFFIFHFSFCIFPFSFFIFHFAFCIFPFYFFLFTFYFSLFTFYFLLFTFSFLLFTFLCLPQLSQNIWLLNINIIIFKCLIPNDRDIIQYQSSF